ncbi:hypothetical protein N7513_005696 [Penicillium frequentans]|nr:hypothetical protein N7513_005696 [Penicillium glabrum]
MLVKPGALWTPECSLLALIYVPCLLAQCPPYSTLLGLCLPIRPFSYATSTKRRGFRRLLVCLVTKGTNVQTVIDSIKPWKNCKSSAKITFHVVLDSNIDPFQGSLPTFVNILKVPQYFQPKLAKYKGRALEWCRQYWNLSESDWVLHLDEETHIDEYLVKACLDFIERGAEDFGMGTVHYTAHSYWKNAFLTTAETSRVAEDFGRFQLPVRLFRRPLFGCIHGSFLLINGAVENDITWNTDCLAEDFWFGLHAARRGFKFGWIHAVAREQAPVNLQDLINQRRRWYSGIMSIRNWGSSLVLTFSMMGSLASASLPSTKYPDP